jgi:hypothetical protein
MRLWFHADHFVHRAFTEADRPEVTVILDGHGFLDSKQWPRVQVISVGRARSSSVVSGQRSYTPMS